MVSPWDLVIRAGFSRSTDVCVISAHDIFSGVTRHEGGLVEEAGFSSGSCSVVAVHLTVCPLCVAQESGFQCGVQGKEGLDQRVLRL